MDGPFAAVSTPISVTEGKFESARSLIYKHILLQSPESSIIDEKLLQDNLASAKRAADLQLEEANDVSTVQPSMSCANGR